MRLYIVRASLQGLTQLFIEHCKDAKDDDNERETYNDCDEGETKMNMMIDY